jgi:hypothetical protein
MSHLKTTVETYVDITGAYYTIKAYVAELIEEIMALNNGIKPEWITIKHNSKESIMREFLIAHDNRIRVELGLV